MDTGSVPSLNIVFRVVYFGGFSLTLCCLHEAVSGLHILSFFRIEKLTFILKSLRFKQQSWSSWRGALPDLAWFVLGSGFVAWAYWHSGPASMYVVDGCSVFYRGFNCTPGFYPLGASNSMSPDWQPLL